MPQFVKKPVVIEAWHFEPPFNIERPWWILTSWFEEDRTGTPCIHIPTLEGEMTASIGDWIIKGVKGEVYPCKPDIFEATYEALPT
jgi:hypothetical protein